MTRNFVQYNTHDNERSASNSWHRSTQTARKLAANRRLLYRAAPHNIEAEQALLGAILVNNEAFYRVSDFLEPQHFFEPIHQQDLRARRAT